MGRQGGNRGIGGHHSTEGDSAIWLTPPHVLAALGGAESFDLDPCACEEPRPWPTARTHFTERESGLTRPWFGRVLMNPPYGTPKTLNPWMRRLAAHNDGVAVIFARTETEIFHEAVWRAASGVFFLEGRLWFHRPDGTKGKTNAGAPSCLVAYGEAERERMARIDLPGAFVPLYPVAPAQGSLL